MKRPSLPRPQHTYNDGALDFVPEGSYACGSQSGYCPENGDGKRIAGWFQRADGPQCVILGGGQFALPGLFASKFHLI
jgi:hypothetical protein